MFRERVSVSCDQYRGHVVGVLVSCDQYRGPVNGVLVSCGQCSDPVDGVLVGLVGSVSCLVLSCRCFWLGGLHIFLL